MLKGTFKMRASDLARSVLPQPVGPTSRTLLFSMSRVVKLSGWEIGLAAPTRAC